MTAPRRIRRLRGSGNLMRVQRIALDLGAQMQAQDDERLAKWETIIRADESRANAELHDRFDEVIRANQREVLRAKVEGLPAATVVAGVWHGSPPYEKEWDEPMVLRSDVLALLSE